MCGTAVQCSPVVLRRAEAALHCTALLMMVVPACVCMCGRGGGFSGRGQSRLDLFRVVIVGPEGTPFVHSLFFFDVSLPAEYPSVPPLVHFRCPVEERCVCAAACRWGVVWAPTWPPPAR